MAGSPDCRGAFVAFQVLPPIDKCHETPASKEIVMSLDFRFAPQPGTVSNRQSASQRNLVVFVDGKADRKNSFIIRHAFFSQSLASLTLSLLLWCSLAGASSWPVQQSSTGEFLETLHEAQSKTQLKDWSGAAALWEKVVQANPVNSDYWRQLGEALYQVKEYRKAIAANEKVIELGPAHSVAPTAVEIARNYALLGDEEQTLSWLDQAWKLGWRDLDGARTDEAFKALRGNGHFRELTASVDVSRMSRDEGWRYDLHLMVREIERRDYAPFRKISRAQLETAVAALDAAIPGLRDNQVTVGFLKIMTLVGDGHSVAVFGSERPELRRSVPLKFFLFEEGLFITAADTQHGDLVGCQVLRIGSHPVQEVMAKLEPIIPRDNATWLKTISPLYVRIPGLLNGLDLVPTEDSLPLTVRLPDGREREVTVVAEDIPLQRPDPDFPAIWFFLPRAAETWISLTQMRKAPTPLYLKHPATPYWFEYLADTKTVYFQFNLILDQKDEPLEDFLRRLFTFSETHDVTKMIIDLRANPGGDTTLVKPLIEGLIRNPNINKRGKLFVIIGRGTFSAAMNAAVFLERNTEALFAGEPTGSSPNFIGETVPVTLPYSRLMPCISDLFWESSWPWDHREWIAPLLYAPPTFTSYAANRDPAVEAIMDYEEKP
jgi:Peptidase family S41